MTLSKILGKMVEGKKPKLSKEMKKILDELDALLAPDKDTKDAEAELARPHKDTRQRGKNGRPMKEMEEAVDFKQQFKEKIAEYKHIEKFGTFSDKTRKEGTVSITGTLVDGSKVINSMEFKGLGKEQTATLIDYMNKALPKLNKELGK